METLLAVLALGAAYASTTAPIVIADGSCSGCAIQQPDEPPIPKTPENVRRSDTAGTEAGRW
jgi:hypothetical protein